jgi:uncharacterized phage-associated protein
MAQVSDIAKYLIMLEEKVEEQMTNLKLQKLLYYCQGFSLAIRNKPLFTENIEAWDHGPVVPVIYHEYKSYGANGFTCPKDFDEKVIPENERNLINEVYSVYGQYSAWGLRNMTHNESPWIKTPSNGIISHKLMKEYFKTKIEK